jgi:hypothetical protein
MTTDRLSEHIRRCLEASNAYHAAFRSKLDELERSGHRIINGGQTDNTGGWDITDWRTGSTIATGNDDIDGYTAEVERLDPHQSWYHIDAVADGIPIDSVETAGIPTELGNIIDEWIDSGATDDDLAEMTGWPASRVRECLRSMRDDRNADVGSRP